MPHVGLPLVGPAMVSHVYTLKFSSLLYKDFDADTIVSSNRRDWLTGSEWFVTEANRCHRRGGFGFSDRNV